VPVREALEHLGRAIGRYVDLAGVRTLAQVFAVIVVAR
jgi:hypothetical protein